MNILKLIFILILFLSLLGCGKEWNSVYVTFPLKKFKTNVEVNTTTLRGKINLADGLQIKDYVVEVYDKENKFHKTAIPDANGEYFVTDIPANSQMEVQLKSKFNISQIPFTQVVLNIPPKIINREIKLDLPYISIVDEIGWFSPNKGKEQAEVLIGGLGFNPEEYTPTVQFNGLSCQIKNITPSTITIIVPKGASTGFITLTSPKGTIISKGMFFVKSKSIIEKINPLPPKELQISWFSPNKVKVGTFVTIGGVQVDNNNLALNKVSINGVELPIIAINKNEITVVIPQSAKTGLITVNTPYGTALSKGVITIDNPDTIKVTVNISKPEIESFSPSSGIIGTNVFIKGKNFEPEPKVYFNGVNARISSKTDNMIIAVVPDSATTGYITVSNNNGSAISNEVFEILTPSSQTTTAPVISLMTPTSGMTGQVVTINGSNFSPNISENEIYFNGVLATVTASNPTSITCTVPIGATNGPISVKTSGGTAISNKLFGVLGGIPALIGYNPTSGLIGQNTIISGANFSINPEDNTVKFNGVQAVVTASTPTTLNAIVPVGATTGQVSITTIAGTVTSAGNFVVLAGAPQITGLSVTSGMAGQSITINGNNFSTNINDNVVKFNGTQATVTGATGNTLTVVIPAGATTGPVSVTTPAATTATGYNFAILNGIPGITGFSTNTGVVGQAITINGNNFSTNAGDNTVKFNGVNATVTGSTSTTLNVTVPIGATTGQVTVTTPAGATTSAGTFIVNQPPTINNLTTSPNSLSGSGFPTKITCTATDPDGDPLIYSWSTDGGSFGTFTGGAGSIVFWTSPVPSVNSYTIRVNVSDSYNPSVSQTIVVNVGTGTGDGGFNGGW